MGRRRKKSGAFKGRNNNNNNNNNQAAKKQQSPEPVRSYTVPAVVEEEEPKQQPQQEPNATDAPKNVVAEKEESNLTSEEVSKQPDEVQKTENNEEPPPAADDDIQDEKKNNNDPEEPSPPNPPADAVEEKNEPPPPEVVAEEKEAEEEKKQEPQETAVPPPPPPAPVTPAPASPQRMKTAADVENSANYLTPVRGGGANRNQNHKQPSAAAPFLTPVRNHNNLNLKTTQVDIVTGKAKQEFFFDPSLVVNDKQQQTTSLTPAFKTGGKAGMNNNNSNNSANGNPEVLSSRHLFFPCTIVKLLTDDGDENNNNNNNNNNESSNNDNDSIHNKALVKTADGTLYKIRNVTQLIPMNTPDDYAGLNDVLHLTNVSEASLLHTMRLRYKRDDIYTSAGPILISINPYKMMVKNGESLYSETVMMKYRKIGAAAAGGTTEYQSDPHLFQVADRAYTAMMDSAHSVPNLEHDDADNMGYDELHHDLAANGTNGRNNGVRNQSIIISGESGAGKTEATKYIMQYLARITKKRARGRGDPASPSIVRSPTGKVIAALEDRVLSSNPLLETFGNAQTLRNDNSSRFGKFIHINFCTRSGSIVGAQLSNYLLEKTRITKQIEGERNYHIFYQLFAGSSPELLKELGLEDGPSSFKYLGNRPAPKLDKDAGDFRETVECLNRIGIRGDEQTEVFSVAAAVLHLGNIVFNDEVAESGEHIAVISESSKGSLQMACKLLGLKEEDVSNAILTKLLNIGGKDIIKPSTVAMAEDKRDAFAKMTYSCLFLWLVQSINETLQDSSDQIMKTSPRKLGYPEEGKNGFIGVLDIYGFECFENNGFEQLLINYCNEKLQRHFNRHLFEVEQNLYASEGVDWSYISFNDNRPCLDLIEGGNGAFGILSTLDDSWAGMGSFAEKDIKFVAQLHKSFGQKAATGHDYFITPKFGMDRNFIIMHYAGEVRYTADEFVEKNMKTLSNELKHLGSSSSCETSKAVYACAIGATETPLAAGGGRRSSIRGVSVGSQFKSSLQNLMDDLETTQPHYIRCIKPNSRKSPNSFASGDVLKQLRYSGMMEAIRIRREGYALREDHQGFFNRFSVLLNPADLGEGGGIEQLVQVLSKRLNVSDADWQIGHSKIFLRRELSEKLERLARLRVLAAARTIGRFGRVTAQRRAACRLVPWVRFRLHMLVFHKKQRAATRISSKFRSISQRKEYQKDRDSVILIQSIQRRRYAIRRIKLLHDPFFGIANKELKKMLKSEKAELEVAIASNNFRKAVDLEARIQSIQVSLDKRQPMTRSILEKCISETQEKLDDAINRKAYSEAEPLQAEVERLVKQRPDFPRMEELSENVAKAEHAVAEAARTRNFADAASLQSDLDNARKRLDDAIAAEAENNNDDSDLEDEALSVEGISSRADLEKEICELQSDIKNAIDNKDFKQASKFQETLEAREKLRTIFPSLRELEDKLKSVKADMDSCVSSKKFAEAEKLHKQMDKLEKKIAEELSKQPKVEEVALGSSPSLIDLDGQEQTYESRFELEEAMKATKRLQDVALKEKQFKKAEECQTFIGKLEELRKALPTRMELQKAIKEKQIEMKTAVGEKRFVEAEALDKTILVLEERLAREASKQPILPPTVNRTPKAPVLSPKNGSAIQASKKLSARSNPAKKIPQAPVLSPLRIKGSVSVSSEANKSLSSVAPSTKSGSRDVGRPSSRPENSDSRPVSKLRPKKPLVSRESDCVLDVAQMLSKKRGDASLVLKSDGGLAGIITDTDITTRVVAKHLDPSSALVTATMTPNPSCVSTDDFAMDAMSTMVENRFRHLPVLDGKGAVVGLLDITKCLNDAITKLEKSQEKENENDNSSIGEVLKQAVDMQGGDGAQAAALQALLGPLMAQAFGTKSSPTLRTLLEGKAAGLLPSTASVLDAGMKMAEHRKGVLIVDDDKLVGLFTFRDMMSRVVAKELPVEHTHLSEVMTPHPESVTPDITVLEALQVMHDGKFLTLPVCEEDGRVLGLLDVMDIINGVGGAEGWRSVFSSAMDMDDASDVASIQSAGVTSATGTHRSKKYATEKQVDSRPVSKLRPKKPLISTESDSILTVTQMLANKRGDASLIVDEGGALAGIITDTDVTRRVVAKHIDPSSSNVSTVMTPHPTCVSMSDSAMDAMSTMVENHFRHLPVVDDNGAVVGLLDIAKCLNDAITKLERSQEKSAGNSSNSIGDALKQAVDMQGGNDAQTAALQALLGPLMEQAFGNESSPTLRTLLKDKESPIVEPSSSLLDTGMKMAETRKGALIVEEGELVGLFTFRDMMSRVVAKELSLDHTSVSQVMTPNPEAVSPDITVLEALQVMHDGKFLTLPVCEEDGRVLGLLDVMDIINGVGGAEGWRSVFSSAMDMDDGSDTASHYSGAGSVAASAAKSIRSKKSNGAAMNDKPVSSLKLKKALLSSTDESILDVVQMLTANRGDAALLVDDEGSLAGIITDTDVTRRVVAKSIDPYSSKVSSVMTPDPECVSSSDSAMEALTSMVDNRMKHLPVTDDNGAVVGLLDIAKCLNDAISRLERSASKSSKTAEKALQQAVGLQGGDGKQAAALHAVLGPLMAQAFGSMAIPTIGSVMQNKKCPIVSPDTSVFDVAVMMNETKKSALVVEDDGLVGIFTFSDMMHGVLARELPCDVTAVSEVMHHDPETISPKASVLEALQMMHEDRVLSLPVCDEGGTVCGLLDVMDAMYACGGAEGWRSIFNRTMDIDDGSSVQSASTKPIMVKTNALADGFNKHVMNSPVGTLPGNIPKTLAFVGGDDGHLGESLRLDNESTLDEVSYSRSTVFKISDPAGHTHRIRSDLKFSKLCGVLAEKLNVSSKNIKFKFVDDEGDIILISNNDDLIEAVRMAQGKDTNQIVKLSAEIFASGPSPQMIAGVGAAVAVLGILAMVMLRPSK